MLMALSPVLVGSQSASAFPKGDSVIGFDYDITTTTHIKKPSTSSVNTARPRRRSA
jgi:hypothetical protein